MADDPDTPFLDEEGLLPSDVPPAWGTEGRGERLRLSLNSWFARDAWCLFDEGWEGLWCMGRLRSRRTGWGVILLLRRILV